MKLSLKGPHPLEVQCQPPWKMTQYYIGERGKVPSLARCAMKAVRKLTFTHDRTLISKVFEDDRQIRERGQKSHSAGIRVETLMPSFRQNLRRIKLEQAIRDAIAEDANTVDSINNPFEPTKRLISDINLVASCQALHSVLKDSLKRRHQRAVDNAYQELLHKVNLGSQCPFDPDSKHGKEWAHILSLYLDRRNFGTEFHWPMFYGVTDFGDASSDCHELWENVWPGVLSFKRVFVPFFVVGFYGNILYITVEKETGHTRALLNGLPIQCYDYERISLQVDLAVYYMIFIAVRVLLSDYRLSMPLQHCGWGCPNLLKPQVMECLYIIYLILHRKYKLSIDPFRALVDHVYGARQSLTLEECRESSPFWWNNVPITTLYYKDRNFMTSFDKCQQRPSCLADILAPQTYSLDDKESNLPDLTQSRLDDFGFVINKKEHVPSL